MKLLSVLLVFCIQTANAQCDIDNLIHPEFDRQIIAAWTTDNNSAYKIDKLVSELQLEWNKIKSNDFYQNNINPEVIDYITSTDQLFSLIRYAQKLNNYKRVKDFIFQLQNDNQQLRSCLADDVYSLDLIWLLNSSIDKMNRIAQDPMLDLLEYNEFEGYLEDFDYYWRIYNKIPNESILDYFPDFNTELHQIKKNIATNCLSEFKKAFDTADRKAFELPCNDLDGAIHEILKEYGKVQSTPIN